MNISARALALEPEKAFQVLAKSQQLEETGVDIIHFEIGQPDFQTPDHVAQAGIDAIRNGITRYTPSLGMPKLRKAIAATTQEVTGVATDWHETAVTPGCKNSIFTALAVTIEPGDEVLYPDPGFPAYKSLIQFFGAKPVAIPLVEARDFSFDMDVFRKKITKKTRAVILNYPGNPTGTVIPHADLVAISQIAQERNLWILTDEIYNRILYTKSAYESIYSIPGMKERTIIIDGMSKSYAMTGWRIGTLVFPRELEERVDLMLNNSISCTAAFTQEAAYAALTGPQDAVSDMVKKYRKRRDFLVSALNTIDGVTCTMPTGAFYVFPNIASFKKSSEEIATYLLEKAHVALLDGTAFGAHGEGYLRLSYASSMKHLQEGVARIQKALAALH